MKFFWASIIVVTPPAPPQPEGPALESVKVSCDDFMKNKHISRIMEVAVGQMFGVILCSNPSTGFRWGETAGISDPTVLLQTYH